MNENAVFSVQNEFLFADGNMVSFCRSPNQSGSIVPEYLVIHFTAGASAQSSIDWLTDKRAQASAHLVIGRDGSVTQLVAFDRKAWHAGKSRWAGDSGLNNNSIGIELDNLGALSGWAGHWRTSWGTPVPDDQVIVLPHKHDGKSRGWHIYSDVQMSVVENVSRALVMHYGLKDVLGHDDIAPGRKLDPGPAFGLEALRDKIFSRG
jgi:N-acetylmuramoyl-L-alanine amidase